MPRSCSTSAIWCFQLVSHSPVEIPNPLQTPPSQRAMHSERPEKTMKNSQRPIQIVLKVPPSVQQTCSNESVSLCLQLRLPLFVLFFPLCHPSLQLLGRGQESWPRFPTGWKRCWGWAEHAFSSRWRLWPNIDISYVVRSKPPRKISVDWSFVPWGKHKRSWSVENSSILPCLLYSSQLFESTCNKLM